MLFKYVLIITAEDENYDGDKRDLGYYRDHPEERILQDIVFGNDADSLWKDANEGLFYALYALDTGKRIGSGILDDSIEEDIEYYERNKS